MERRPFKKTLMQYEAVRLLTGDAMNTLLFGGARSGKTFIIMRQVILRALLEEKTRHCCIRKHFVDINKSIINDTFPSVMEICFPNVPYLINKQLFYVEFPNKSQIWFGGLDAGDKILGNEYSTMYFNECSELSYSQIETAYSRNAQKCEKLRNRSYYDENPVGKAHWSYKLFIQGLNPIDNRPVSNPKNYANMRMNPADNLENLSSSYMETLDNMSAKKRARFRDGEWQDDNENALWKRESMISPYRVRSCPVDLERVVVAIDPAVTNAEKSDETGIVIAGRARNPASGEVEYYVLDDRSRKGTPNEWAKTAIDLYVDYDADRVIAEVNNGGDLVETVIRGIDASVSYSAVRATRGKILRAEPISALYERGLVHHVGEFQALEDEMCNYTGASEEDSPDRLDALVWALTELSGGAYAVPEVGEISLSF